MHMYFETEYIGINYVQINAFDCKNVPSAKLHLHIQNSYFLRLITTHVVLNSCS